MSILPPGDTHLLNRYDQPAEFRAFIAELQHVLRSAQVSMRPHWGKLHNATHTELTHVYPRLHQFMALRTRLDPGNLFVNEYLTDVLNIQ